MNIITAKNFVAGIFQNWTDAQHYLTLKPSGFGGSLHFNNDMIYPFFVLEVDGRFTFFQIEAEARAQGIGILYTISEDYQPNVPWADWMGSLEHVHLNGT